MVKGLQAGGEEGGKTTKALEFIGVKARDATGALRPMDQVLVDLARELNKYEDSAEKLSLVQDVLGKGAERYIPMLKDIAEGSDLVTTTTTKQAAQADPPAPKLPELLRPLSEYERLIGGQW